MATIALYASRVNLMSGLLKEVKQSVADYQAELFSLSVKSLTISSSVCNMDDVTSSIQASTRIQERKLEALEELNQRSEEFIEDAAKIDDEVADLVRHRRDDFYTAHPYLKPECDKSWLEWAGDKLASVGEWCKENWKAVALIVGMIVCMVACAVVTAVCPAAGAIIVALSKAFLLGQLIGGGIAAGLTALQGGSFREIAESYFDGAFLGGYGALIACLMMTPLASLTLGGAVAIGGVSAGLPQTLSYYGDRFFKGEEISDKEIIIGSVKAALQGAIFSGIFFVMYNGINFKESGGGTTKGGSGTRNRLGEPVTPTEKTLDMALDPETYANAIAEKYGINLRGSGQDITIKFNPDLRPGIYGRTTASNPYVIEIGPDALMNETELANTIAHELNHARDFIRGGEALEDLAYKAGNALADYINGGR